MNANGTDGVNGANGADAGSAIGPSSPSSSPSQQQTAQVQQPQSQSQQLTLQPFLMLSLPFTVVALVLLIRAMPWPRRWLERRPLSCGVCLSLWVTFLLSFAIDWFFGTTWPWVLLHLLPVPGIAVLLLAVHARLVAPTELPLPPLEEPRSHQRPGTRIR